MPKNYKKTHPRILDGDIYSYIASNSNLTMEQAKECFLTYSKLLEELAFSEYIDEETTIALPKLGHFKFVKRPSKKKGETYSYPTAGVKGKLTTIVLEEDEPPKYIISFKVSATLIKRFKTFRKEMYERHKL